MKKFKRKWQHLFWILPVLILSIIAIVIILNKNQINGEDFKLAILADDGVAMVSFSPERKMINILKLDRESKLWIPGGLGWYRNEVIKGLLTQEKQLNKINDLFFYNFGFKADKILILPKIDDWKNKCWLRYSWWSNKMLLKEEILNKDIKEEENLLDEIMIRDLAETKIVKEDLKLSVFNLTNISGLANFIARRLEWMGFSVISTETLVDDYDIDNCLIKYKLEPKKSLGWKMITDSLNTCKKEYDKNLNDGEMELYFGNNFSSMIKYPSYNNK